MIAGRGATEGVTGCEFTAPAPRRSAFSFWCLTIIGICDIMDSAKRENPIGIQKRARPPTTPVIGLFFLLHRNARKLPSGFVRVRTTERHGQARCYRGTITNQKPKADRGFIVKAQSVKAVFRSSRTHAPPRLDRGRELSMELSIKYPLAIG